MDKLEALKYLEKAEFNNNEWTEAGMYHAMCKVIKSRKKIFKENYLKALVKEAEAF